MNITGKTPLFRAKNLEALLGVGRIYLKLEGANPYGHKFDRLAEFLVRDSIFKKMSGIVAEGPLPFIQSVIYFSNSKDIPVIVPISRGETKKHNLEGDYSTLEVKVVDDIKYRAYLDRYCSQNNYFNAYNGVENINTSILALEEIGDELYDKFGDSIDNIFLQLSYGIGLTGIHNSFQRRFIRGISQRTPALICCTTPKGNIIYEKFRDTREISSDESKTGSRHSRLVEVKETELLQASLSAVYDTNGTIMGIDEDTLTSGARMLKSKEGINVSIDEAYSFAGLVSMARGGRLQDGNHIVILNDGKSSLDIEPVKPGDYTIDQLHRYVDMFLKQYSDSYEEITDAIDNASEKGTILLAKRNDVVQGIAVVVNMGFKDFIPTYHLGYIGTNTGNEGRGIATKLLEEVINFTNGNVSLHVDIDNKRAMRVYEKMGFKHCYNRMIYSGWLEAKHDE